MYSRSLYSNLQRLSERYLIVITTLGIDNVTLDIRVLHEKTMFDMGNFLTLRSPNDATERFAKIVRVYTKLVSQHHSNRAYSLACILKPGQNQTIPSNRDPSDRMTSI